MNFRMENDTNLPYFQLQFMIIYYTLISLFQLESYKFPKIALLTRKISIQ